MLDELKPRAQELKENRARFEAYVHTLTDAQWDAPVGEERYSPRQTVAHLSGAARSMTRMGQNWVAGKDNTLRSDFDLNFFNRRQQEKRANMTHADLLEEWREGQDGVAEFMESVGEDDLDRPGQHPTAGHIVLRDLFKVITTHEADHIRQMMGG